MAKTQSWKGRPIRAFLVRALAFALPLAFAVLVTWQVGRLLPRPQNLGLIVLWWLAVIACSTLALNLAQRATQRLLPLAALMKLSLVFPDRAPSRFGVSLKASNMRRLEQVKEEARAAGRRNDLAQAAESILALGAALNVHDPRTRGHGERVRAYADMLGDELGLDGEARNKLIWAAMLHDIGKLQVPSEIINRTGGLSDEEWLVMRKHPEWGMALTAPLADWLGDFRRAVGEHHERYDGTGYPHGLSADLIAPAARITAVADSYDVMTSVRSYKDARPAAEAREELARNAGHQFDPDVVRAFLNISLGRQRWVAGPLAWFAQVPLFQTALQGLTSATVVAQSATAALVVAGAALLAPALLEGPTVPAATGPSVAAPTPAALPEDPPADPPADPPVVVDDAVIVTEDAPVIIDVLGNDSGGVQGASVGVVEAPDFGTASVLENDSIEYEPEPDYAGPDGFTYEVCSAENCDTGDVELIVEAVNDPPTVGAPRLVLTEDTQVTLNIRAGISDPDGDAGELELHLTNPATNGSATLDPDGVLLYLPAPDYAGDDSVSINVCDAEGACSLLRVAFSVEAVNDPPRLLEPAIIDTNEDNPGSLDLAALFADPEGDNVTISLASGPSVSAASVTVDGSGVARYQPVPNWNGAETFTVKTVDGAGAQIITTVDVAVRAVNDAPVLGSVPNLGTIPEGSEVTFSVSASDVDHPGALSYSLSGAPAGASIGPDSGAFNWTPSESQGPGSYSFKVVVTDGGSPALSHSRTVSVSVTEANNPPVIAAIGSFDPIEEGSFFTFDADALDPDDPPNNIAFFLSSSPAGMGVDPATGVVTWTPSESQGPGTYTFQVVVADDASPSLSAIQPVTVTVTETNQPPSLGGIGPFGPVPVDSPVTFTAVASDSDDPANTLAYSLSGAPSGAVIDPGSGAFSWTPGAGDAGGVFSFQVVVTDGGSPAKSAETLVTITVAA